MTLLAPLFLAGLLGIGLPIWLHRLSSENPNRKPFSSLMFLEEGEPQRVLAKNVQYLLLLALRIAVLVLLALAFAQPAFWREAQSAAGDDARLRLIVVDTSASMQHGDRWERARDEVLDLIDGLAAGDRAQLVAAGRSTELLSGVTADPAELRQAFAAASPGLFYLDYGQMTRALEGVIRSAELPVVMHVVTDAQASGMPTRFADLSPREPVELALHDVAPDADDNWVVDGLGGSALTGELTASVRSFAAEPASRRLRLELNGRELETRDVELPAGGAAQVNFGALPLEAGSNRVSATLEPGDDLALDDTRYVALRRPEPRPVLLVSGDLRGNNTLFVAAAMESLAGLSLAPARTDANGLADEDLADYHFVVVADAGALGAGDSRRLQDYVESGGAVLLALGPRSSSLAAVPLTDQPLTSGQAGRLGAPGTYASIGALDAGHPALEGAAGLRAARFFRVAPVVAGEGDRVLASLDNGAPLLVEREVGDGRVLVFASSLDKEWNDLPLQPVFVPLIAGLSEHLLGGAGFSNEAELGSTLAVRAMGLAGGQIFDPDGEAALGLGGTDDVLLTQIGFYELVGGGRTELVAVNFDLRESDLTPVAAEALARWQGLGRPDGDVEAAVAAPGAEPQVLAPIAAWLLILLLAALVVESWVGNWHLRIRRGIAA